MNLIKNVKNILDIKKTFYKNTYCEFTHTEFDFSKLETITTKSGSRYHYTEDGVYRYSNHWGRVANCRWKLKNIDNYKNQNWYVGFAKWSAFFDLKSVKKCCFLSVDFTKEEVLINFDENSNRFLFTINQALKRQKDIKSVFKNDKFLKYFDNPTEVKKRIISELINTGKSLQQIKLEI